MSSAKRPYNEAISSNSSRPPTTLNDNNDYTVNVQEQQVEQNMNIEQQEAEQENFISRRKKLNADKDDCLRSDIFTSNPFPSNLNDNSFQSPSSSSSTRNTLNSTRTSSSISTSFSRNTRFHEISAYPPLSENIESRTSFNKYNESSNSPLKVSEDTKALSSIDLPMSSKPTSTPNQNLHARTNTNASDSFAETLNPSYFHTSHPKINDDSFNNSNINNTSPNNTNNCSSSDDNINNNFSIYSITSNQHIRTQLEKNDSKGPFEPIYSQIYDEKRMVFDLESFNYLIQLYEFCDNSSTKLQSNITSILRDLVLLLNDKLDGFDIPFIEHHKWNGSYFYGPIDIATLLDHLDDGLGLSSAEYVFYDNSYLRPSGSVLQCGCRRTFHRKSVLSSSPPKMLISSSSDQSNDDILQNNELRHAVLDRDAEREAQRFLELLAEEEDGVDDDGVEQKNYTEQDSTSNSEEESDSFTEISKESEDDSDDDDDGDDDGYLIRGFVSANIQQSTVRITTHTDTFGNPINPTRTTSTRRRISRPSNNDGDETDDSLDGYLVDSGNSTESTFEEIDISDIESIATDSTVEDGWNNISRDI